MLDMKKMLLLALVSLFVFSFGSAAMAQDKVGYVDPQKILVSHPKYEATQKQLDQFAKKKADATKIAVDKEKDPKKKSEIYEKVRALPLCSTKRLFFSAVLILRTMF